MPNPIRYQLSDNPEDPFAFKGFPKWSPRRVLWTAQSRGLELLAGRRHCTLDKVLKHDRLAHSGTERGDALPDTAVTSGQLALLVAAVRETEGVSGNIAEIGSYRGVSTLRMAQATAKRIFAIDPFIGYGGADEDHAIFAQRISEVGNITHLRVTSGEALRQFAPGSLFNDLHRCDP